MSNNSIKNILKLDQWFRMNSVPQWPSDISGNDWCGPVNSSLVSDRMSDENFGANPVFLAKLWAWNPQKNDHVHP